MSTLSLIRRTAFVIVLSAMIRGSFLSDAQASTPVPAVDQSPRYTALHMIGTTDGWAVVTVPDTTGFSNAIPGDIYAGTLAYVLRTHDGGQTWADVTPPPPSGLLPEGGYGCDCSDNGLAGFFFLDTDHAWLMINDAGFPDNQAFNGISVRVTDSGGQSWQESTSGMEGPFVITSNFIDPLHGWVLIGNIPAINSPNQPALLFRTLDGGLTWKLVADDGTYAHMDGHSPLPADPISPLATSITPMNHEKVVFESPTDGWMLVNTVDPGSTQMLRTTSGGVSWNPIKLLPNATTLDDCTSSQLTFAAPSSLSFLASCYTGNKLYYSADDGQSWQSNPLPDSLLVFHAWPQLFMLNPLTGWALGCDVPSPATICDPSMPSFLSKATNAGATWSRIAVLPDSLKPLTLDYGLQAIPKLDFVDDQTGWAIDPRGDLLATTDSGRNWTPLHPTLPALPDAAS